MNYHIFLVFHIISPQINCVTLITVFVPGFNSVVLGTNFSIYDIS